MAPVGRTMICVWEGACLWLGRTAQPFDGPTHAHHAIQLTLLIEGRLRFWGAQGGSDAPVTLIDSDVPHAIAVDGLVAHLFIEPESRAGRVIRHRYITPGTPTPAPFALAADDTVAAMKSVWAAQSTIRLEHCGRQLIDRIGPGPPPAPLDPRVRQVVDRVAAQVRDGITFAAAAHGIYLSHSRLRHLFAEQVGLPFKTYVLWRRLIAAVDAASRGMSLTMAAHEAGFADAAHFSRTFRRAFGLPASALAIA